MDVAYQAPLRRSWARARRMLFPFRLETWLVLGFAAFLSEFLSGGGGGGGSGFRGHGDELAKFPGQFSHVWAEYAPWLVAGAIVLCAVGVVLMWVNARGKFVFLDDVVRERVAIVEPWRRFARLGRSLFLWRLALVAIELAVGLALFLPFFAALRSGGWPEITVSLIGSIAVAVLVAFLGIFVSLLLDAFIVPLMHRHDLTTNQAWSRFLPLLHRELASFVLFALLLLVLAIAFVVAIVVVGVLTCCVGLVLFALPYVGQVVLLPLYVFFRGLGPDFLAQFGPDFDVFAGVAPAATAPAGATGAPVPAPLPPPSSFGTGEPPAPPSPESPA